MRLLSTLTTILITQQERVKYTDSEVNNKSTFISSFIYLYIETLFKMKISSSSFILIRVNVKSSDLFW